MSVMTNAMSPRTIGFWVALVLIAAALLRFGYQEGMMAYGGSFHNGSDSGKYLAIAEAIYERGEFGRIHGDEVRDELNRMPIYPYFLAGIYMIAGKENLRAVVIAQVFVELLMIALLALGAAAIDRRLAIPAAIVAAIIPNFLVQVSYVLTETVFLLFFVGGLAATLWAICGKRILLLLTIAGASFAASLMTRPVMMFFPVFLFLLLLYALPKQPGGFLRKAMLAAVPGLIMFAVAAPKMTENYREYRRATLTIQSGNHLIKWIYPCLRTPWSCASHGIAWEENKPIVDARVAQLSEAERKNPVAIDMIRRDVAIERILELGMPQILFGSAVGAFKNLIQTGAYETFTQYRQPITFFAAMPGGTFGERFGNFLQNNKTNIFMGFWLVAQIFLVLSRGVQLVGLWSGLADRTRRPFTIILTGTIVYFLVVNGPIGNPKYRIPMEPALILLFSIGFYTIFDWRAARRGQIAGAAA